MRAFFAWCDETPGQPGSAGPSGADDSCALRPAAPATTEGAFLALVADRDASPQSDTLDGRESTLTGQAAARAAFLTLYSPDYAGLAIMLEAARDGQPGPLLDLLDQDSAFAAPFGVAPLFIRVLDFGLPAGATAASWRAYWEDEIVAESPLWGPFVGPFELEVRVALLAGLVPDDPVTSLAAEDAPPFLFVGGAFEPVAPVDGARATMAEINNDSVMLETEHLGHFALASACVMERAEAYRLDPSASVLELVFDGTAAPGARVVSLALTDGTPIVDGERYRVAAPDYVIYGGTGSAVLAEGRPVVVETLDEVLATYLASRATVTPTTDGRITRVAP